MATGYAYESFQWGILWQGVFFVCRAVWDRVRFWPPPQRHPPTQLKFEYPPPPPPGPRWFRASGASEIENVIRRHINQPVIYFNILKTIVPGWDKIRVGRGGGGTFDIVSPIFKIVGDMSPCPPGFAPMQYCLRNRVTKHEIEWQSSKLQNFITSLFFNRISSGFHCFVQKILLFLLKLT